METGENYSLASDNFMMAFALEDISSQILAYDQRYIRWIIRTWDISSSGKNIVYYPLHLCSEEEMSRFFTAENDSTAKKLDEHYASKSLYCLHPSSRDFNLQGSFLTSAASTTYDVWLTSCASRFELFDGSVLEADEDCVWDQKKVIKEYLGDAFYMSVYHNT